MSVHLTKREMQILVMLAQGMSGYEMCERLHIARNTLYRLRGKIYRTLGVTSCFQAAYYAWTHGIVSVDEAWEAVERRKHLLLLRD